MSTDHSHHHIDLALGYAEAARRVLAVELIGAERLAYFSLVAHGLELAMKAMLASTGYDEERLMLIGHDLRWCCEAVMRKQPAVPGISDPQFIEIVDHLAAPHALQRFRYPQPLREPLPDPSVTLDVLQRLIAVAEGGLIHRQSAPPG